MLYLSMHTIDDPQSLTEEQQQVIRAAAHNHGVVAVQVSARTRGRAVCAGRTGFFDPNSRDVALQYIEALHDLVDLQILRSAGARENYELTNSGWQISRKLGRFAQ